MINFYFGKYINVIFVSFCFVFLKKKVVKPNDVLACYEILKKKNPNSR